MLNFQQNYRYLLKERGFNFASFARHLITKANESLEDDNIQRLRRKLNRLAAGDTSATIKDVKMLSLHLDCLPGLLAFASHDKFIKIYGRKNA